MLRRSCSSFRPLPLAFDRAMRDRDPADPDARFQLELEKCVKDVKGSRAPKDGRAWLRALRNAVAHGRVEVRESVFVFTDIGRKDWVSFGLSWADTGRAAEVVFWVSNEFFFTVAPARIREALPGHLLRFRYARQPAQPRRSGRLG